MKHLMKRAWTKYALVALVTALVVAPTAAIAIHGFTDVPDDNIFHNNIQWMKDNGVTAGCNPPANDRYCPNNTVTRGQMAAFMQRLAEAKVVDAATAVTAETATLATTATNATNADKLDGLDSTYFLPAEVPLGKTIRGTIGAVLYTTAASQEGAANAQLPIPAPVGLTDAVVTIAGSPDDTDGACTGTATAPTAAPGFVCVYSYYTANATANAGYIWGSGDGTKWGFQVSWNAASAGHTAFFGNWAYTAPLTLAGVSGASSPDGPTGVGGN